MISADEFAAAVQSVSPRHGRAVAQLAVRQGARWDQVQEIRLDGPAAPEITVQGDDGRRVRSLAVLRHRTKTKRSRSP